VLSLRELRRATALADGELAGARVDRIVQPDGRRLVLTLHHPTGGRVHLLLSAEPGTARLSRLAIRPAAPGAPPAFTQLLRARLDGARFSGARIVDEDRQVALRFETPAGSWELLLALLGPRTNLYLLDADGRVAGALRPFSETRRELSPGAAWRRPASAPPPEGGDRFASVEDDAFFAALEARATAREEAAGAGDLRRRIEKALRRAGQSAARKLESMERDAESGAEAADLRHRGELLKSALGQARPGARRVLARDFTSGEEVEIELDPARTPRANLEDLFRRARKAEKRAERAQRELGTVRERHAALRALGAELAELDAESPAVLEAFAGRPEVARLLARYAPEPPGAPAGTGARPRPARPAALRIGRREIPQRLAPRRFRSSDGLEIWVGRSDEGNDLLTTRLARGNDLFFHLDASPGSHVVLRTEGRPDPPAESVLEAAELSVHFSRQRRASGIDVLVAPIKNVRKPRGAKPGLVAVSGGRRVHLRRDPRRLERILASRIDGAE
jgi:predicted ribosome quality control (RQC) complex YloA/Tae2 family protein